MSDAHPNYGYELYLQRLEREKRKRRRTALKGWATRRAKMIRRGNETARRDAPKQER